MGPLGLHKGTRGIIAAAAAVAIFMVVDFGLASAQALEDDTRSDAPASFVLPAPLLGDRARYQVEVDERAAWQIETTWLERGAGPTRLPDGTEATGDVLVARYIDPSGDIVPGYEFTFDGGTPRLLTLESSSRMALDHPWLLVPAGAVSRQGNSIDSRAVRYAEPSDAACLFDGALAGTEFGQQTVIALPHCLGFLQAAGPLSLIFAGAGESIGHAGIWYTAADPAVRFSVLMGPNVPYPLVVDQTAQDNWGHESHRTYRLVGFEAGHSPRDGVPGAVLTPDPQPGMSLAPTSRVLLDDADVNVPFRLVDAVAAAHPVLARYDLEHPSTTVVRAFLSNGEAHGARYHMWHLTFADGDDWRLELTVLSMDNGGRGAVIQAREDTDPPSHVRVQSPFPSQTPRAVDLLAQYTWLTGNPADCYGYSFLGESWNQAQLVAGTCLLQTSERIDLQGPGVGYQELAMSDVVWFNGHGQARHRAMWDGEYGAGATGSGGAPLDMSPPPQLDPGSTPGWLPQDRSILVGAGSVAIGVGLLVYLWPALKGLPAFGLFSRLREDELANHPTRRRILEAVAAKPGIHLNEIGRATGIPNGSLTHHARRLVGAGLLVVRRGNGYACYFSPSSPTSTHAGANVLKAEGARRILAAIAKNPRASAIQIGRDTGFGPATVHHHLKRLTDAGLVRQQRNGRSLSLEATWAAKSALAS